MQDKLNYPRTSRYHNCREVKTVVLYGRDVDSPTFDRRSGKHPLALIGVPNDSFLHECGSSIELSCEAITHAGAEAVLSFACDDADPDFLLLASKNKDLQEYLA
jgi:hypothetical protein